MKPQTLVFAMTALVCLCASSLHATAAKIRPVPGQIGQGSLAPMIEKVLPTIVSIRVKGFQFLEQNPLYNHPLFGQMVTAQSPEAAQKEFLSSGSGVIVDADRGLIITNFHVIEQAKEIKVHMQDGRQFDGKLLGSDAATDVAAIQIEARDIVAAPIGDSARVRIGDLVVALGNPFGLEATATLGMVSSLRRTTVGYRDFESYIQHDAAVNSGNSGGALIGMSGELIGINTAILSPSGGNIGLGFAIPIKMAMQVMEQLVKYHHVRRGWAGAHMVDLSLDKVQALDLGIYKGALVSTLQKDSPASKAGVGVDDVVVGMTLPDSRYVKVNSAAEFKAYEAIAEVGQKIILKVSRQGKEVDLPVEIADLPRDRERAEVPKDIVRLAGMVVGSLEADSPVFGEVKGVEVIEVKPGTLAQFVGLLPGDIITQVDQDRVRRLDDFMRAIKDKNAKFEMRILRSSIPIVIKFPI